MSIISFGAATEPSLRGEARRSAGRPSSVSFEVTPSVGVTESQVALEQLKHLEDEGFLCGRVPGRRD